ncbi:MAG: hypothetical protein JWL59_1395 [Chthoniobacteraceae bacterium]|nr:hypothetical protein [Chthoniobacteraceae bacterium]
MRREPLWCPPNSWPASNARRVILAGGWCVVRSAGESVAHARSVPQGSWPAHITAPAGSNIAQVARSMAGPTRLSNPRGVPRTGRRKQLQSEKRTEKARSRRPWQLVSWWNNFLRMDENPEPKWKVYRRGSGLVIRGSVRHPRIQKPELVHNPCAPAGTISFAVHLEPCGPYWSAETLETTVEHFEPDVPSTIRRVEIIFAGGKVIIESQAKE